MDNKGRERRGRRKYTIQVSGEEGGSFYQMYSHRRHFIFISIFKREQKNMKKGEKKIKIHPTILLFPSFERHFAISFERAPTSASLLFLFLKSCCNQ